MILSRRALFGLAVSAVFLALVFWRVDLREVGAALRQANYVFLLAAVLVYFAAFWLRAVRWRILLGHLGAVTVGRAYWVSVIGYAANNVLPLRLGELLRSFLLRRDPGINATASLGTIAVERVLDGLTLLAWLGISLLFLTTTRELPPTTRLVLQASVFLFGGAALGFVVVVLAPTRTVRVVAALLRPLPARWEGPLLGLAESFLDGLRAVRRARLLPAYVLLSNGIWAGEAILYFIVVHAMGIDIPLATIAAAVAASNLATSIPSSSGAIGPFELLAKETLVLSGVGASVAAAYAVLVHATLLVPVTIVGFVLLLIEGVSLREALRLPKLSGRETGIEVSE